MLPRLTAVLLLETPVLLLDKYFPPLPLTAQVQGIPSVIAGVLEAASPSGELYDFDRTATISAESANQIANAAQTFGQQDDITVLTLQRMA
jgi:hypothetical protein